LYRWGIGAACLAMGISYAHIWHEAEDDAGAYAATFRAMTIKQHEVLRLLVENRTSKEIAALLGVTESAINQRIETVRERTGALPRARLARAYLRYLVSHDNAQARPMMAVSSPERSVDGAS
jgi:DNA-binding CsgD family transcriptional regulator